MASTASPPSCSDVPAAGQRGQQPRVTFLVVRIVGRRSGPRPGVDGQDHVRGSITIFACCSGSASASNAPSTPRQPHGPGHERPRVDLALGDHVQRVAELQRRVAEHEPQIDLLGDRHRRADPVGLHADPDDDHPGEQRRAADDAVEHPGHADAFEDDRALGRSAERLGGPPDVMPRHRQARELLHRADRELGGVRQRVEVTAVLRPCRASRRSGRPRHRRHRFGQAPAGRAEKSLATTWRTPRALSMEITARPTGPHPITIATSRFLISDRRTAWYPIAIGSVSTPSSVRDRSGGPSSATPRPGAARRTRRAPVSRAPSDGSRSRGEAAEPRPPACPLRSSRRDFGP